MSIVTLIHGDGIGKEVMQVAKKVINATKVDIEWEERVAGDGCMAEFGTNLPIETIASVYQSNLVLKGPTIISESSDLEGITLKSDVTQGFISAFGLYSNYRSAKSFPNLKNADNNVNIVVFREMTEDLYAGVQRKVDIDTVQSIKQFTRKGCTRFIESAFEYAMKNNRKKVTIVHQADKMEYTDGLFLEIAKEISVKYPDITIDEVLFDIICTELISNAKNFDVLVCPNMYGDVISRMVSHISGTDTIASIGTIGGGALGIPCAVFEPLHGAKIDEIGSNTANPIGAVLAGSMMLAYMDEHKASENIEQAVYKLLAEGTVLPEELGGLATTNEICDAIIANLE